MAWPAAVDLVIPLAVYYGLRAVGTSQWLALLGSATAPAAQATYTLVRQRRIDGFATTVLVVILASIATSFVSGSPRFLLAKDGWLTAVVGLALLATLRARRPAMFVVGRAMVRKSGESADDWDELWDTSARFRRVWRMLTALWGVGVLLDAAVRVVMAYTLPIDAVPALSTVQWIALLVVLQVISQIYLRRPGIKPLIFG